MYPSFDQVEEKADVIIDFSHPSALEGMLDYAKSHFTPVVIGSTGYTPEQKQEIQDAAKEIPVFFSFNMSLGVNLLVNLAKKAAQVLGDQFDIEIVEKHHNQKLDAPSGTALMIADAIQETMGGSMVYQYDRHAQRKSGNTTKSASTPSGAAPSGRTPGDLCRTGRGNHPDPRSPQQAGVCSGSGECGGVLGKENPRPLRHGRHAGGNGIRFCRYKNRKKTGVGRTLPGSGFFCH